MGWSAAATVAAAACLASLAVVASEPVPDPADPDAWCVQSQAAVIAGQRGASAGTVEAAFAQTAPDVVLGSPEWLSSQLVSHVAAVMMREFADQPASVRTYDDAATFAAAQSPYAPAASATAAGDSLGSDLAYGRVHAMLEAWPSVLATDGWSRADGLTLGTGLSALGPLGADGRNGFYFPTSVLDDHPLLADEWDDPAVAAEVAAAFGGVAYSGSAEWDSQLACDPDNGIFANLGIPMTCQHVDGELGLRDLLAARVAASEAVLLYLWEPLDVVHTYDLTRARLPCFDLDCYARRQCDYPSVPLVKVGWSELHVFFPERAVALLRRLRVNATSVQRMLEGLGAPGATVESVACDYVRSVPDEAALFVTVDDAFVLQSASPASGTARGGTRITLRGRGFGTFAPFDFEASVGGAMCAETTWISSTEAVCITSPAAGQNLDITLRVGFDSATLRDAFSYDPAVLYGVAPLGQASGSRQATVGSVVTMLGDSFVDSTDMLCRFEDVVVRAAFVSFAAVECGVPGGIASRGVIDVAVSNDGGDRWNGGVELQLVDIQWPEMELGPDGTPLVPLDLSPASVPPTLSLALLINGDGPREQAAWLVYQHILDEINADPSLLRHTTLNAVGPINVASLGDYEAGEAREAAAAELWASLRAEHADLVGIVGKMTSSRALAMAAASAKSDQPWPHVSYSSTNPTLSNSTALPNFLRVVASDKFQGAAMLTLVTFFESSLVQNGLLNPETRALGAITFTDSDFAAALSDVFVSEARSAGYVLDPVIELRVSALPEDEAGRQAAWEAILAPLVSTATRTIAVFAPTSNYEEFFRIINSVMGLAEGGFLWLGPDSLMNLQINEPIGAALGVAPAGNAEGALAQALDALALAEVGVTASVPALLYDAVWSLARGLDALVNQKRSADLSSVISAQGTRDLMAVLRTQAQEWPSATGFGGWQAGSNDPVVFNFDVKNIFESAITRVGSVSTAVILTEPVRFPNGGGFQFRVPASVTLGVAVHTQPAITGLHQNLFAGLEAAVRAVNADGAAYGLANTTLRLHLQPIDSAEVSSEDGGAAAAIAALTAYGDALPDVVGADGDARPQKLVGVTGFTSVDTVALTAAAAGAGRDLPVFSPSATLAALEDPEQYPLFARVIRGDDYQAQALVDVVAKFKWTYVSTLYFEDELYASGLEQQFTDTAEAFGITVHARVPLTRGVGDAAIDSALAEAASGDVRVFVLCSRSADACPVIRRAIAAGIVGSDARVMLGLDGWVTSNVCGDAGEDAAVQAQVGQAMVGTVGTRPAMGGNDAYTAGLFAAIQATAVEAPDASAMTSGDQAVLDAITAWRSANAAAAAAPGGSPPDVNTAGPGYDLVLVVANTLGRMFGATQDASDGNMLLSFLKLTSALPGTAVVLMYDGVSNQPTSGAYDVVNHVVPRGGTVADLTGLPVLRSVGRHSDRGWLDMTGCQPGFERRDGSCKPCPVDSWKGEVGDFLCDPCPSRGDVKMTTVGVVGAADVDVCLCPAGLVQREPGVTPPGEFACDDCPAGGTCDKIGLPLSRVVNQPGWWRGDPDAVFVRCLHEASCQVTGLTLPQNETVMTELVDGTFEARLNYRGSAHWNMSTPCSNGYTGPACNVCVDGFGKNGEGVCGQCPDKGLLVLGGIFFVMVLIAVIVVLARAQLPRVRPLEQWRRVANTKTTLVWFQINSFLQLFEVFSVTSALTALLAAQGQVTGGVLSVISADCLATSIDHSVALAQFRGYLSLPAVVVMAVALAFVLGNRYLPKSDPHGAGGAGGASDGAGDGGDGRGAGNGPPRATLKTQHVKKTLGDQWNALLVNVVNVTIFLIYPTLVATSIAMFDCTPVDDGVTRRLLLRADFRVDCDTAEYATHQGLAVFGMVVYVLGIPGTYALLMFVSRRSLFLRTLGQLQRPSTPMALVLEDDAKYLAAHLRAVLSRRSRRASMHEVRVGSMELSSTHRRLEMVASCQGRFDAVHESLCRAAGLGGAALLTADGALVQALTAPPRAGKGGGAGNGKASGARHARVSVMRTLGGSGSGGSLARASTGGDGGRGAAAAATRAHRTRGPAQGSPGASANGAANGGATGGRGGGGGGGRALRKPRLPSSGAATRYEVRPEDVDGVTLTRRLQLLQAVHDDTLTGLLQGECHLRDALGVAADKLVRVATAQIRYGFLILNFRPETFAWELWVMILKFGMATIAVLGVRAGPYTQAAAAAVLVAFALLMLLAFKPQARFSTREHEPLYKGRAERLLRAFLVKAVRKRRNNLHFGEVLPIVMAREHEARTLRALPVAKRVPEQLATEQMAFASYVVTLMSIFLGVIAYSVLKGPNANAGGAAGAAQDPVFVLVAVMLVMINVAMLLVFASAIGFDLYTEQKVKVAKAASMAAGFAKSGSSMALKRVRSAGGAKAPEEVRGRAASVAVTMTNPMANGDGSGRGGAATAHRGSGRPVRPSQGRNVTL